MDNIKQFLEAKKLQNPEDAALFILTAHMAQDEMRAMLAAFEKVCEALVKAKNDYGKEGGPWNVPSEPGTWIAMAQDSLTAAAPWRKGGV